MTADDDADEWTPLTGLFLWNEDGIFGFKMSAIRFDSIERFKFWSSRGQRRIV